jgi:hypothetical protein
MTVQPEEPPSFTKRIAEIGVLAAVLIYFTGWTYLAELFEEFGLSSHVINLPVYSVFVYAYEVLFGTWAGWLVTVIATLVIASTAAVKPSPRSIIVYLLLGVLAFPLLHLVAAYAARNAASEIRSGKSYLVRAFLRPSKTYPENALSSLTGDDVSLIATTADAIYVVKQSTVSLGGTLPNAQTYILPLDDFAVSIELRPVKEAK